MLSTSGCIHLSGIEIYFPAEVPLVAFYKLDEITFHKNLNVMLFLLLH